MCGVQLNYWNDDMKMEDLIYAYKLDYQTNSMIDRFGILEKAVD